MTTVQIMFEKISDVLARLDARGMFLRADWLVMLLLAAGLLVASGCAANEDRLEIPSVLISPYDGLSNPSDPSRQFPSHAGDALWAVAPLANESGVSSVDTLMIADKIAAAVDEARGLTCLPVNRTIAAMRSLGLPGLRDPADAQALAGALGVDGLILGSVTAYDPYDPPKLGLSLTLLVNTRPHTDSIDPMKMQGAYSDDQIALESRFSSRPAAVASNHLDAANHDTLARLKLFAQGRHELNSARGYKSLLSSMDRYTQFAAYVTVSDLIDQERLRVGSPPPPPSPLATPDQSSQPQTSGDLQSRPRPDQRE